MMFNTHIPKHKRILTFLHKIISRNYLRNETNQSTCFLNIYIRNSTESKLNLKKKKIKPNQKHKLIPGKRHEKLLRLKFISISSFLKLNTSKFQLNSCMGAFSLTTLLPVLK